MKPEKVITKIEPVELLGRVNELKGQGCRIVQICCSKEGDGLTLDYSFDLNYKLIGLQIPANQQDEIASISAIFPPAFLYENEIESLFGLKFINKAVDFGGKLYQTDKTTPFVSKDGE